MSIILLLKIIVNAPDKLGQYPKEKPRSGGCRCRSWCRASWPAQGPSCAPGDSCGTSRASRPRVVCVGRATGSAAGVQPRMIRQRLRPSYTVLPAGHRYSNVFRPTFQGGMGRPSNRGHRHRRGARELSFAIARPRRGLSVILPSCGSQPSRAVFVKRVLPGQEFLGRNAIAFAGVLPSDQTATHCRNHLGLAQGCPAFDVGGW